MLDLWIKVLVWFVSDVCVASCLLLLIDTETRFLIAFIDTETRFLIALRFKILISGFV